MFHFCLSNNGNKTLHISSLYLIWKKINKKKKYIYKNDAGGTNPGIPFADGEHRVHDAARNAAIKEC